MTIENYKLLALEDKDLFDRRLADKPPDISELTFTNLFMWRHYYRPVWREYGEQILIICDPPDDTPFGLPPIGAGNPKDALRTLCADLVYKGAAVSRICRVGASFIEPFVDEKEYRITPTPEQSDYVYLTEDLINLSGRKYHQKKNHLNQFIKNYDFECVVMDSTIVRKVLDMQESWCELRECSLDSSLSNEDLAVFEALTNFDLLGFSGLAILINNKVAAFNIGEPLNPETMVIHIEKADPEIRGLYTAVNQIFCRVIGKDKRFINREQDLGREGLRKAKLSYKPHHMVDKYTISPLYI